MKSDYTKKIETYDLEIYSEKCENYFISFNGDVYRVRFETSSNGLDTVTIWKNEEKTTDKRITKKLLSLIEEDRNNATN